MDQFLGFDWHAYFHFVMNNALVFSVLSYSYTSLTPITVLAFFLLFYVADINRVSFFLDAFLVTAVACTVIGMLFPAKAAVYYYIGGAEMFPHLSNPPGLYHLPHMEQLRSGVNATLDPARMPDLVTFPSFHTAAGLVLVWSFRGTRFFLPVLVYAALMISATPVLGGHYFVDLIAGAVVAAAVLAAFQRAEKYQGSFVGAGIAAWRPARWASRSALADKLPGAGS